MEFYPFFMQCNISDVRYKNLSIGIGGLIFSRGKTKVLCVGNGEFCIPDEFSEQSKRDLLGKLNNTCEFDELSKQIALYRATVKRKSDKIRDVNNFVLVESNMGKAKKIHAIIVIALLLKLIDDPSLYDLDQYNKNFLISQASIA